MTQSSGLQTWHPLGRFGLGLQTKTPLHVHPISQNEYETLKNTLKSSSIAAPLNYYTIITSGINAEDDKQIPPDRYDVKVPVFFGAALRDYVCLAQLGKEHTARRCSHPSTIIKEYDGDHWIMFSHAEQIAADLHSWIKSLKVGDSKL
jgi:pimeloyl-ACP methyl ester carboxylesterase